MIRINLLPLREERKREKKRFDISVSVQLFILTGLICGYLYTHAHKRVKTLQNEVQAKEREVVQLTQKIREIGILKKKEAALSKRIGVINELNKRRFLDIKVMEELSRQVPKKIWFKSLQLKKQKLTINGIALDNQTVSVFISKLNHSNRFFNVWLDHSREITLNGIKLKEFSINCNILAGE